MTLVTLLNYTLNTDEIEFIQCMEYDESDCTGNYLVYFVSGSKHIIKNISNTEFDQLTNAKHN